MRKLILTAAILSSLCMSVMAQNTYKGIRSNIVQVIDAEQTSEIMLKFDGDVEVKEWDRPLIKSHLSVQLNKGNQGILNGLMAEGYYDWISIYDADQLDLILKIDSFPVFINGEAPNDQLKLIIYVPKGTKVNQQQ